MQKIFCYSIEVRVRNVANKIRTSINASYEKGSKFYVRSTVECVQLVENYSCSRQAKMFPFFGLGVLLRFSRYYLINTYGLNYINFLLACWEEETCKTSVDREGSVTT